MGREKLRIPFRSVGWGGPPSGNDEVVGVSGGEEGTVGRRANLRCGVLWRESEESESQSDESDEDDIEFMCKRRRRWMLGGLRVVAAVSVSVVTAIVYEGLSTEENPVEENCSS